MKATDQVTQRASGPWGARRTRRGIMASGTGVLAAAVLAPCELPFPPMASEVADVALTPTLVASTR